MGLGLVYGGLGLSPGDEVVTTEHDHYATHEALRLTGAEVRKVRLYDDPASGDDRGHARRAARRDHAAHARARADLGALGDGREGAGAGVAATSGRWWSLDGVHALAVENRAAGPRLRRVRGRHAQVARRPARHRDRSGAAPGTRSARRSRASRRPGSRARASRPAAGTPSSTAGRWRRPSSTSPSSAARRSPTTSTGSRTRLKDGLAKLPHVRLITPRDAAVSPGIVCFEVDGMDAATAVSRLLERGIRASVTPYAAAVRAARHLAARRRARRRCGRGLGESASGVGSKAPNPPSPELKISV